LLSVCSLIQIDITAYADETEVKVFLRITSASFPFKFKLLREHKRLTASIMFAFFLQKRVKLNFAFNKIENRKICKTHSTISNARVI
jgi:hypothetical protein